MTARERKNVLWLTTAILFAANLVLAIALHNRICTVSIKVLDRHPAFTSGTEK